MLETDYTLHSLSRRSHHILDVCPKGLHFKGKVWLLMCRHTIYLQASCVAALVKELQLTGEKCVSLFEICEIAL